jgi:hypothetical protein
MTLPIPQPQSGEQTHPTKIPQKKHSKIQSMEIAYTIQPTTLLHIKKNSLSNPTCIFRLQVIIRNIVFDGRVELCEPDDSILILVKLVKDPSQCLGCGSHAIALHFLGEFIKADCLVEVFVLPVEELV